MSKYAVENREYAPKNVFAGEFPTLTEAGTASAALEALTPVVLSSGKLAAVAASGEANVVGITVEAAGKDEPVVYFMTGEFNTDALNIPNGVDTAALKAAFRKLSIFLR